MTDQSLPPQFVDDAEPAIVKPLQSVVSASPRLRPTERTLSFIGSLDKPLLIIVSILVSLGILMVFSTTYDWSFSDWGNPFVKVLEHMRNVGIGAAAAVVVTVFGYKRLRRFAVPILLVAISALIAVQFFGEDVFNARRSLIAGRFQPSEFAELAIIIYMAAWMGSKNARIRSLTYGLIPFSIIVGVVVGLVVMQPDLSTAVTISVVCGVMFFLAGADLMQLVVLGVIAAMVGVLLVTGGGFLYAEDRVGGYLTGITDITQADYHVRQAYIAFANGGWTGRGLGESLQKFNNALPAPHTDSIFAIIGEEFGILGAAFVVVLYGLFVWRGFTVSRRASDPFGALLAVGLTIWVVTKALLNIAVMLALVPPTGITLPFISFGGSSLVTLMVGVGLLLSVQRSTLLREHAPERRVEGATSFDRSRGDGRARVPRARRS